MRSRLDRRKIHFKLARSEDRGQRVSQGAIQLRPYVSNINIIRQPITDVEHSLKYETYTIDVILYESVDRFFMRRELGIKVFRLDQYQH